MFLKTVFQGTSAFFIKFLTSRSDSLLKDRYMGLTHTYAFWGTEVPFDCKNKCPVKSNPTCVNGGEGLARSREASP